MIDINKYFKIADEINNKVATFLLEKFGTKKEMFRKTDSHIGIPEDVESNNEYVNFLEAKSPNAGLYTEEGNKDLKSDMIWVVDSIEGTSNYRSGNPFWATQIALLYENDPLLAIVNAPSLNQKFWAMKARGAFLNGKKIRVNKLKDLGMALVDFGRGTKDVDKDWAAITLSNLGRKIRTNRAYGSSGLGIAYCAAGISDAYLASGGKVYDYLPACLIIREAGGVALNLKGKDWRMEDPDVLATNEALAGDILEVLWKKI